MSDKDENKNETNNEKKWIKPLSKEVEKFQNLTDEEIRNKRLPGPDSLTSRYSLLQKPSLLNDEPNSSKNTSYTQDSDSRKTTLYNIHAPFLKACLISTKTISYADEEILSRDLRLGDDIQTTKMDPNKSTTYETSKFKSTKEKINFVGKHFCKDKLIKAGLSAGANIFSQDVDVSLGGHYDSNKLDKESNDDYSLEEASNDYTFLKIIRFKIIMPPKDESVKLNRIALRELEKISSLKSAHDFLIKYGSHFLKADYDLGANFLRFLNKSKNHTSQNSMNNSSQGTGYGGSGGVKAPSLVDINAGFNNNQNNNQVSGADSSETEQKTGDLYIITGYSAIKDEETFQKKTFESYEHLHVVNHNEIAQKIEQFISSLNKNELNENELKQNFNATFLPIWKLLDQDNSKSIEFIKVMCSYIEESLYFNAKFKSLSKRDCNESLIDNYLDYINEYLLHLVIKTDKYNKSELNKIRFNILHQDVEFLKKLYQNRIDYISAGDYLNYSRKNSKFYLLCYNEDLKCKNNNLWEQLLTDLCNKSRDFKCAILNYRLHNDLNGTIIKETVFDQKLDIIKIENNKVISDFELREVESKNKHLLDNQVIGNSKYVLTELNIQLKRFYNKQNDKLIIPKDLYLIEFITQNAFKNSKHLVEINLSNNQIRYLTKSQFNFLENVKKIDLSFNLLDKILAETFTSDLKKLEILLLNNNRLNNIDMADVPSLKGIDLENNQLEIICKDMLHSSLESLEILNLKNNQIRRVHLVGLSKLKEINLENNQLESILEETFDSNLENLEILNLKNNQIRRVRLVGLSKLKKINLENNQLESILEETFDSTLENLEVLNLNKNQISSFQPNSFKILKNLKEIYLENNLLKEIDNDIFFHIYFKNNLIDLKPCQNFGYINDFLSLYNDEIVKSILNRANMSKLIQLCEFSVNQKWNLIYRASQDGFEAAKFHANCDNKPNTLTVIKSTNGNVFGGYTEQTWNHTGDYKADPNSYIFSLINKLNKPIKMKWSKNVGIFCHTSYGPIFGRGHDLHIADRSNTNKSSHSNLGYSYSHPDYACGSNEAKSFLAGSYNFQVSEIEVYTKQ